MIGSTHLNSPRPEKRVVQFSAEVDLAAAQKMLMVSRKKIERLLLQSDAVSPTDKELAFGLIKKAHAFLKETLPNDKALEREILNRLRCYPQ